MSYDIRLKPLVMSFSFEFAMFKFLLLLIFFLNADFLIAKEKLGEFDGVISRLESEFDYCPDEVWVLVSIEKQNLQLLKRDEVIKTYPISSSKYGIGCQMGSFKTPVGGHRIKEKIGAGAVSGTIFKGRVNSGKKAVISTKSTKDHEDLITSRILWLDGLEKNVNKGGKNDSHDRYIYIHGTHEEGLVGKPFSQGCIRMKNKDIIEFFDLVKEGTLVMIVDDSSS